jgi:hypothetical protein
MQPRPPKTFLRGTIMTEAASAIAILRHDQPSDQSSAVAVLQRRNVQLRAELDEVEPVITASLLVATAFRLRDQDGLLSALRLLVEATRTFEERRACA